MQSSKTISNVPRYIDDHGVLKINPVYNAEQKRLVDRGVEGAQVTTVNDPSRALAVISSTQDMVGRQLSEAARSSVAIMQDPDYLNKFNSPEELDGGAMLDSLSNAFAKYEVPLGLVNKLLQLQEYKLDFIIDNSSSMGSSTDVLMREASVYVKRNHDPKGNRSAGGDYMTRWEEVEDRLHAMIDMLAYIPIPIVISFLSPNRSHRADWSQKIILDHSGITPQQFIYEAHSKISAIFRHEPDQGTPIYARLKEAFLQNGAYLHYLFTDGEPSDASGEDIIALIKDPRIRPNPKQHPLTFIKCCTEKDAAETAWMKAVENDTKYEYVMEVDDFKAERDEVREVQGPAFPYTKGVWLLCHLVAAISPEDLGAMERAPFTRRSMETLTGRKLSDTEYQHYFSLYPNAKKYSDRYGYAQFARDDIVTSEILNGTAKQMQTYAPYAPQPYAPPPSYAPGYGMPVPQPQQTPGYYYNGQFSQPKPQPQPTYPSPGYSMPAPQPQQMPGYLSNGLFGQPKQQPQPQPRYPTLQGGYGQQPVYYSDYKP